jgi:hypothetical protein
MLYVIWTSLNVNHSVLSHTKCREHCHEMDWKFCVIYNLNWHTVCLSVACMLYPLTVSLHAFCF